MKIHGCDCSIVIKTANREMNIPYSDETIREAVSVLQEETAIEGDGVCRALRKSAGVTGCVVTPLTIDTVPLLLYVAMGFCGNPVFISETRNLYQYRLKLLPMEDCSSFDLIQDRNNEQTGKVGVRKLYERCRVQGFELRIMRGEAIKLKLDIISARPPVVYPYIDTFERVTGERFSGDSVTYRINGQDYTNIYGITIISKKQGSTKTELWIKRFLSKKADIPAVIEEVIITAQLLRTQYEYHHFGMFRITLKRLVLVADETEINTTDTVIGPLRYYVTGGISAEVFGNSEQLAGNNEQ